MLLVRGADCLLIVGNGKRTRLRLACFGLVLLERASLGLVGFWGDSYHFQLV